MKRAENTSRFKRKLSPLSFPFCRASFPIWAGASHTGWCWSSRFWVSVRSSCAMETAQKIGLMCFGLKSCMCDSKLMQMKTARQPESSFRNCLKSCEEKKLLKFSKNLWRCTGFPHRVDQNKWFVCLFLFVFFFETFAIRKPKSDNMSFYRVFLFSAIKNHSTWNFLNTKALS